MLMPLFDIILLPHGAGGDREEVSFSSPSSDINPCSSLLSLLADNILGKKGQSRETGPWGEALTGGPQLAFTEVRGGTQRGICKGYGGCGHVLGRDWLGRHWDDDPVLTFPIHPCWPASSL